MQLKKQTHRGKGACSLFVQQVCTNAGSNPRANGWDEFRVGDVTEYDLGCVSALHLGWLDGHGQPGIPFQSDPYARHHIVTPTKKHSSTAPQLHRFPPNHGPLESHYIVWHSTMPPHSTWPISHPYPILSQYTWTFRTIHFTVSRVWHQYLNARPSTIYRGWFLGDGSRNGDVIWCNQPRWG